VHSLVGVDESQGAPSCGLRFASLGSGSSGNATLIANESESLLIDCGFSVKETLLRLARINHPVEHISAILVTHEHGDHAKGVGALARRFKIPVYMSHGTSISGRFDTLPCEHTIVGGESFEVGGFSILPITVPHDAREPLQFVVSSEGTRIGVLTDLGSVSPAVLEHYSHCDALVLEANHDLDMLACGPYPYSLQQRVGSAWGHLNNQQTKYLLEALNLERVQHLVVGHISEKNNCLDLVRATLAPVVDRLPSVHYATQNMGFDWLVLD